jgi:hypothetical protein
VDIAIVDSKRILWLENPHWNEHVLVSDPNQTDHVCFAPHDIDEDGRMDFAVGADWTLNTHAGGTIQWITGAGSTDGFWKRNSIGSEPTVHRMRFADCDGDGRDELIVVPLLGRGTTRPHFQESGVRILSFAIPRDPVRDPWNADVINDELHVTHNIWPTDLDRDGHTDLLVTSFEGVSLLEREPNGAWRRTLIGSGDQESSPNRGASEIKHGRMANGSDYLAAIEPWHGNQVVVYTRPSRAEAAALWDRRVIDRELQWGHAVWCANLDGDADEELIVGVRDDLDADHRRGIRVYDSQDVSGHRWTRTLIDPGGVAVEDLGVDDLNGDGRADIVAVGRQTHNVKIYWNDER